MGAMQPCSICGTPRDPSERCPKCGNTPEVLAAEITRLKLAITELKAEDDRLVAERKKLSGKVQAALRRKDLVAAAQREGKVKPEAARAEIARLNKSVAEMNAQDVQFIGDRKKVASKLLAAQHQQTLLTNAEAMRRKKEQAKPRLWRRGSGTARAATAAGDAGTGEQASAVATEAPPAVAPADGGKPAVPRQTQAGSGATPRPRVAPLLGEAPPPEASPRSVQNVMLALGALLVGIAAVVFAAVALSNVNPGTRLAVLVVATAGLLVAAPLLVRAGLSSTAESLATIGLVLVPIDGYVLGQLDAIEHRGIAGTLFAGLVFSVTAAVALLYHRATRLTSARYGAVLALQPILPLLTYQMINGPAGWALVLTLVAAINAVIARAVELSRPTVTTIGWSSYWLRELSWVLHGLAIGAAGAYGVAALATAVTVPSAARAAATLLLAAAVGMVGALMLRKRPLSELAAGLVTLAVIGSAARVASVALPERALLVTAAVVAVTGLAVRSLPAQARRGPQLASALALATISVLVIGSALRAAVAPVLASLPVWQADLTDFRGAVADRAGQPGWQLAGTVALLTVAAALALPPSVRREAAVVGTALTALAAPAALGLGWAASQWVLAIAAIGLLAAGIGIIGGGEAIVGTPEAGQDLPAPASPRFALAVGTVRSARVHLWSSVAVGAAALLMAAARPWSAAGVLGVFAVAGMLLALAQRGLPTPAVAAALGDTAAGVAAFAAPSAVGAAVYAWAPSGGAPIAMAAALLTGALTLVPVAQRLVVERRIGLPLAVGVVLGAAVPAVAAFMAPGSRLLNAGVAGLVVIAAVLLTFAPSLDANRRADRWLDGADMGAAAVTAAVVGALARMTELTAPRIWLVASALLLLVVALAVRALPEELNRGPMVGIGITGGLLGAIAGYPALVGGVQALTLPGELWNADIGTGFSTTMFGWQAPAALVVLAVAAAVALRPPRSHDAAAAAIVLATVGTPAALGWVWWSPIVLGLAIATVYAITAVTAIDPRAGYARFTVAVAVALHALASSLVRGWSTAAALGVIALVSIVVAGVAVAMTRLSTADAESPAPGHLEVLGGAGVLGALLAGPGALAALATTMGHPRDVVLTATLAGISIGLAGLAVARRQLAPYLGWGTVGVAASGSLVALFALLGNATAGVFAAAVALLVVLAELLRTSTIAEQPSAPESSGGITHRSGPQRWRIGMDSPDDGSFGARRWGRYPGAMAAAAAALPTLIALVSLTEAIRAAILTPYDSLRAIWQGPPSPLTSGVDEAAVLTSVLLTATAALAAVGFGGGLTRAVSVVVPGLAVTILITPIGLGLAWPASVLAGLTVFTVCMLSVALTEPPSSSADDRSIKIARLVALAIGLIAGGAGLAGSLATPGLTIFTFGGAVAVGATAALGGRSEPARILGWLGGAVAAELFVLTLSLHIGAEPKWAAFGVLAVGAALVLGTALLPRLRRAEAWREAAAAEFAGYAAAVIALVLAISAPTHVAALLVGWGAVLGVSATRPDRTDGQRRMLYWAAGGCEVAAWWLIMRSVDVVLPEAYTLPFAAIALTVGLLELRRRPTLGSWAAYGPALIAGFGPTVVVVLVSDAHPVREVTLLLAGILTLVFGSTRQQRAPVAIGATVTTITALHALTQVGNVWLAVLIGGIVLIALGADSERRRRATDRYQQMR